MAPHQLFCFFKLTTLNQESNMSKFWSPAVNQLTPYVPGEQPKITDIIKLNTNENPYPPAPGVQHVLHHFSCEQFRKYPDPDSGALKQTLADYHALNLDQVFVGNGSDEVLAHTFMAFFRQEHALLMPNITYSFYDVYCNLFDIDFDLIPLKDDFSIDIQDYTKPNGGIIFANPNAPTGRALALDDIESLLKLNRETVVVVDEAYVDFGAESAVSLINQYPNLLVIQTLSKSRSLAGMRIGFALGNAELIEGLERVKNSFNSYPLDMIAQATAIEAFKDQTYFEQTTQSIIKTREWTVEQLTELGFSVIPSKTNFVFTQHKHAAGADLMKFLRENKIIVRHFNKDGISNFLRISIGTDEEMRALINCLKTYPEL
jgi:histidinol-phosphate aminotransferase